MKTMSLVRKQGYVHVTSFPAWQAEEKQTSNAHSVVVDGKMKFRSHLSTTEKSVVKKAADGVSAEFGLRLLDQTPGARTLIRSLEQRSRKSANDAASSSGRSTARPKLIILFFSLLNQSSNR